MGRRHSPAGRARDAGRDACGGGDRFGRHQQGRPGGRAIPGRNRHRPGRRSGPGGRRQDRARSRGRAIPIPKERCRHRRLSRRFEAALGEERSPALRRDCAVASGLGRGLDHDLVRERVRVRSESVFVRVPLAGREVRGGRDPRRSRSLRTGFLGDVTAAARCTKRDHEADQDRHREIEWRRGRRAGVAVDRCAKDLKGAGACFQIWPEIVGRKWFELRFRSLWRPAGWGARAALTSASSRPTAAGVILKFGSPAFGPLRLAGDLGAWTAPLRTGGFACA